MEKFTSIKCCQSGCTECGDERNGLWGDFIFCTKHNQELLDQYARDVDADMFEENIILDQLIFDDEKDE